MTKQINFQEFDTGQPRQLIGRVLDAVGADVIAGLNETKRGKVRKALAKITLHHWPELKYRRGDSKVYELVVDPVLSLPRFKRNEVSEAGFEVRSKDRREYSRNMITRILTALGNLEQDSLAYKGLLQIAHSACDFKCHKASKEAVLQVMSGNEVVWGGTRSGAGRPNKAVAA